MTLNEYYTANYGPETAEILQAPELDALDRAIIVMNQNHASRVKIAREILSRAKIR